MTEVSTKSAWAPNSDVGALQALGQSELGRHYAEDEQSGLGSYVTRDDVQQGDVSPVAIDEGETPET